ncbi:MAG: 50S ribosomal protein L3 [Rickettsiales bacterium]|nr:50S ribosomal protein L3 [Rickettsiales bacterium]
MRTGLLAKKIGMSRIFYEDGTVEPVTIFNCPKAKVIGSYENNGKHFVKIASFIDHKNVGKLKQPQLKDYKDSGIKKSARINDFNVSQEGLLKKSQEITVSHFVEGQFVDVQGTTIGKGFAGGMKRHGFGGLEATHGVSISHRSHGSTGQCQDPGRVFKGKKMAGHLGDVTVTQQNLRVLAVDSENEIIAISGSVPGKKGSFVKINDSIKKSLPSNASYPTFIESNNVSEGSSENEAENKE